MLVSWHEDMKHNSYKSLQDLGFIVDSLSNLFPNYFFAEMND